MTEIWLYAAAVFALANTVLIIILLSLYSSSFRKIRSSFTIGLILFALFFLIQNIAIIIFWYQLYSLVSTPAITIVDAASPYMTAINLIETIALAVLVRVSMK
jgi:hypothetical protein